MLVEYLFIQDIASRVTDQAQQFRVNRCRDKSRFSLRTNQRQTTLISTTSNCCGAFASGIVTLASLPLPQKMVSGFRWFLQMQILAHLYHWLTRDAELSGQSGTQLEMGNNFDSLIVLGDDDFASIAVRRFLVDHRNSSDRPFVYRLSVAGMYMMKRCEIELRSQVIANRNLYIGFRLNVGSVYRG